MPAREGPSVPLLLDLAAPGRGSLADPDVHRRLARHLLLDVLGVEAFALFRRAEGDRYPAIESEGWAPATVEALSAQLGEHVDPVVRGGPSPIPAERLLGVRPDALLGTGEPAPARGTLLTWDDRVEGILLVADPDPERPIRLAPELLTTLSHGLRVEREVTTILRSHDFVRSILRDASTGLIATDPLGRVIYVNAAAEAILGVTADEAQGADSLRVFRTMVDGENVLLEGLSGDLPGNEVWLRRPDGREIPVELRLSQIRSQDDRILGVVGAFHDLSELKGMQDRLRHRDRLATVGELAAGIAHEIGNPLTGIRSCAQILRDRLGSGDESQELVRVILEEVDRLGRLASQVRHYVRPRMQKRSAADAVERVIDLTASEADEAGVAVHWESPPDCPEIYHDPDQVEQVVMNLVQNAIHAMRDDGGRLTVELRPLTRRVPIGPRRGRRSDDRYDDGPREVERAYVRLSVSDTGPGIPPDVLERIWNPFFTTKPDGLGLGLSLSQTIVQEHAGSLSVVSRDGKGTTFILDLPVDRRAP